VRVAILTYSIGYGAFATVARNSAKSLAEVDILYLQTPVVDILRDYPDRANPIQLGGRALTCRRTVSRYLPGHRLDALITLGGILNLATVVTVVFAHMRTPLILNEQSPLSYKTRVEHRHRFNLRGDPRNPHDCDCGSSPSRDEIVRTRRHRTFRIDYPDPRPSRSLPPTTDPIALTRTSRLMCENSKTLQDDQLRQDPDHPVM